MQPSLRAPLSLITRTLLVAALVGAASACSHPHASATKAKPRATLDDPPSGSAAQAVPTATAPVDPIDTAAASSRDDMPTATPTPAPTPAAAPAPSGAELHEVDGVSLHRLVVATDVRNREPVGAADHFSPGQPLVAFLELENKGDDAKNVIVTFEQPDGTAVGHVQLSVPAHAPRWRTWARTHNAGTAGTWQAVVRTPDGALIGRLGFDVGAGAP